MSTVQVVMIIWLTVSFVVAVFRHGQPTTINMWTTVWRIVIILTFLHYGDFWK